MSLNFPFHSQWLRFWMKYTHLASSVLKQNWFPLIGLCSRFYQVFVHINMWLPRAASLSGFTENGHCIQMGPLSDPCCPIALRRCLQLMGANPCPGLCLVETLSGDDRPWGKPPGECECTGVRLRVRDQRVQRRAFQEGQTEETTENMTLPEKEPFLPPFLSSSSSSGLLPQTTLSL